jgi:membrane carboxypeptidase/penicillin-binding protein PbpC
MTDILSDPSAVCITFGCGGLSVPGHKVAVKTGTSQPFDQNGPHKDDIGETLAFGYTSDYVVGVWDGNADNSPISGIFSTTIAFPTMSDIMLAAYREQSIEQSKP